MSSFEDNVTIDRDASVEHLKSQICANFFMLVSTRLS